MKEQTKKGSEEEREREGKIEKNKCKNYGKYLPV